jgi:spermidine/putrescine transport system permease protein
VSAAPPVVRPDARGPSRWPAVAIVVPLFAFIYLPVAVLVLFSFHANSVPVPPFEGPSFEWYAAVLDTERITDAAFASALVGVLSSACATALATLAAWGLARHRVPAARWVEALLYLPLAVSTLVIGVGLLVAFVALGIDRSLWAVGIGHVVLNLPLAFVVLYGQFDRDHARYEQAARDLGATEVQVFVRVTLPLLRPALLGAFLLSLTFSWDEFVVAFLLSSFDPTLPVVIWGMLRTGLNPQTNAAGTLVFLVSLVAAVLFELTRARGTTRRSAAGT